MTADRTVTSTSVAVYGDPTPVDADDLSAATPGISVAVADDRGELASVVADGVDCVLAAVDEETVGSFVESMPVPVVAAVPGPSVAAAAIESGAAETVRTDDRVPPPVLARRVEGAVAAETGGRSDPSPIPVGGPHGGVEHLLSRVDDAFLAFDEDWEFTYVNDRAGELLDRDAEELIGRNVWEEFPAAEDLAFYEEAARAVRSQEPVTFEEYYPPLSIWLEVSVYPDPHGVSVFLRDVTARVEREDRLRRLLEATRDLMAADTRQAVMETASNAAREVLDFPGTNFRLYDPENEVLESVALGATVDDVDERPPYDVDDSPHGRAFRSGETVVDDIGDEDAYDREVFEQTMYVPVGDYGVLSAGILSDEFSDADRQLAQLLAATTEVALARAERRERLLEYERTLEAVAGMVYTLDEEGRFSLVSSSLADRLGYEQEELVGTDAEVVLDEDGIERRNAVVQRLLGGEDDSESFETEYVTADGRRFPVEVELAVLTDPGGTFAGSVGVVKDITELTRARERAEIERSRFTYLFENLPDPVVEAELVDGEPMVRNVNPAFETVFGYVADAIVGESLDEFLLPESHDGDRGFDRTFESGEVTTREVSRETADGRRHFLHRGVAYDDDGDAGFVIYTDVTDRKRREQYLQVIARVLRHNLRNDVSTIGGYAELIADAVEDGTLREYATAIRETAEGIADLSDDARELQTVLVTDETRRHPVDTVEAVGSVIRRHRDRHPDAQFSVAAPDSVSVLAGQHLEGVIDHLVENAVEHNDGDPRVHVDVRNDGDRVILGVADDGEGIPEQELSVVAGNGNVTQLEHGSGLGLWFVRLVAGAYGGEVAFESSEWGGTRAILSFEAA